MNLLKFTIERYKGYAELAEVDLAPLTIFVGSNNSGKTALAQAIQLFAGGLDPSEKENAEPLPLKSGEVRHGEVFEDLLTGRAPHGWLNFSAHFMDAGGDLSIAATVQNVVRLSTTSLRQVKKWSFRSGTKRIILQREQLAEGSPYSVSIPGEDRSSLQVTWNGLIPNQLEQLPSWIVPRAHALKAWARGVRYLQCPRHLCPSPFAPVEAHPHILGPTGWHAPMALAADDELRQSVRAWYRKAFGVHVDVAALGRYFELVADTSTRYNHVPIGQSGQGLSHVLPVVVTALTARDAGPGVDIIEHPEAELHPASHAHITELLLNNLAGPARPLVVETHSDMVILRARRQIAEGRLRPENVLVYWIQTEARRGSVLRKITIDANGNLDSWPEGVFIEDYEEIMAIRRAARRQG